MAENRPRTQFLQCILARASDVFGTAGEHEEMRCTFENQMFEIRRATASETFDGFAHLEQISRGAAKRNVHVCKQSARLDAAFGSESHHRGRKFTRLGFGLHEGGGTKFH